MTTESTIKQDTEAMNYTFGIEFETQVLNSTRLPVRVSYSDAQQCPYAIVNGERVDAPSINGQFAKAMWDVTIHPRGNRFGVEWVTPVLKGQEGLDYVEALIEWIVKIGGSVNKNCGLHIHVGIDSINEGRTPSQVLKWFKKFSYICKDLETAIYGQTGTRRDQAQWCSPLNSSDKMKFDNANNARGFVGHSDDKYKMVNFQNVGNHKNTIEFRAFAGTLNKIKVFHHLATALGICSIAKTKRTGKWIASDGSATKELDKMYKKLEWFECIQNNEKYANKIPYGMFGTLLDNMKDMKKEAKRLAKKYDNRF